MSLPRDSSTRLTPGRVSLDGARVEACLQSPEEGPRLLFFSGGSALKGVSRELRRYTHNSAHLITPFDSGGSSAVLREAFGIFGVGDLRNRLLALAEDGDACSAAIVAFMSHRLASDASPAELDQELRDLAQGTHPLAAAIPLATRGVICEQLQALLPRLPAGFDLRGASVGNLVLSSAYLAGGRDIDQALEFVSRVLHVHGVVRPTAQEDVQLVALHANGTRTVGQHLFGKGEQAQASPIVDLELVRAAGDAPLESLAADERVLELIGSADLICYPMGSFFSSVLANLLPAGIGRAICERPCPKVFVPNAGLDPEMHGHCLSDAVQKLVEFARRDLQRNVRVEEVVQSVMIDPEHLNYSFLLDLERTAQLGVSIIEAPLATSSAERVDAERLVHALLSISD